MSNTPDGVNRGAPRAQPSISPDGFDALAQSGHLVLPGALPSNGWFRQLYRSYDVVSELMQGSPALLSEWQMHVDNWKRLGDNASFFCGVPPIFKDRSRKSGKRDKEYLQYCKEFSDYPPFRQGRIGTEPAVRELMNNIDYLNAIFDDIYSRVLECIAVRYPWVIDRVKVLDRKLAVIVKMLRYNPNPSRFATGPHFDKSCLSIIANSDDDEISYRLSPYKGTNLRYSDLYTPVKKPKSDEVPTDAVIINGLCLREIGIDTLPPTPHSVPPIKTGRVRHSIVSFLLVPHLDTSMLSPKAIHENDVFPGIS